MKTRILAMLLLLGSYAGTASAQQAVVKSMTETTDFIAGDDQRRDYNNQLCALVKVQVVDDMTDVEGNVMGEIVNRGVEKWVYLAKGSKNMTIHLKNHLPLTVNFSRWKIPAVKSNRVYVLVIDAPNGKVSEPQDVKRNNSLQLDVAPAGAELTLWGKGLPRQAYRIGADGTLRIPNLPYGRYHYRVTADGYQEKEDSVFVTDEDKWISVKLALITGTLAITCPMGKADFYVNDQLIEKAPGATSWTGEVIPGEYVVEARRNGYVTQTVTIPVEANRAAYAELSRPTRPLKDHQERDEKKILKEQEKARAKEVADSIRAISQKTVKEKKQPSSDNERTVVFGIRAGLNFASIGLDEDADGDVHTETSFHVGPNIDVGLTEMLHLNASLLFSQKGYSYYKNDAIQETAKAQFIMLPVLLSFRLGKIQLNAGPYVELGIGGEIKYGPRKWTHDTFDYYDALNYGFTIGAGASLGKRFYLGANYEIGWSDYANRNIAVSLGVNF